MPYKVQITIDDGPAKDVTKTQSQCLDAFHNFSMYVLNEAIFSSNPKNVTGRTIIKHLNGFRFDLLKRQGDKCIYALKQNQIQGNTSIVIISIDDIKNHYKVDAMVHSILDFTFKNKINVFKFKDPLTNKQLTKCYHFSI